MLLGAELACGPVSHQELLVAMPPSPTEAGAAALLASV